MKNALREIFNENCSKKFIQLLDCFNVGILIIDTNEIIKYINPEYRRITKSENITGLVLGEVRTGAVLPKVVKTGRAMNGVLRRVDGIEYVVDMAPVYIDGAVAGGISVVKEVSEIMEINDNIKRDSRRIVTHSKNVTAKYNFGSILGLSSEIKSAKELALKFTKSDSVVLIYGESGTGKEMFAHAIHDESSRRDSPFVALNCASLSSSLLEAELFGYVGGAFTGAKPGGKLGLFQVADGGTLFLDEIGELDISMQAKLLRVLQEKSVRMVGDYHEKPVDVRIIAASNKDLEKMVEKGEFRKDLMYRLNVMRINIPPLRERKGDSAYLSNIFLSEVEKRMGTPLRFTKDVYLFIEKYEWKGNVRELKNFVEYLAMISDDGIININLVYTKYPKKDLKSSGVIPLKSYISDTEAQYIKTVLEIYGNTLEGKNKAAKALNISLATLYNKLNLSNSKKPE